ncbi:tyrosine-type recombinase/integrase [bacterium]|nr:tyrosine-type recombinase/integrase [bacterium]
MRINSSFPALLEAFFTDRLMRQRKASPHTIAAYRDTFRLLFRFAEKSLGKPPSDLKLEDLDATFIGDFLHFLETDRSNSSRSRNVRLAALHSFFRYVAFETPEYSALIQRVLAIPSKRCARTPVDFLTPEETEVLLAAPDLTTWIGRRDHALVALALQTGLRVSELTGLCREDVSLDAGAHIRCMGKGRKERCTPLTKQTASIIRSWLKERDGQPTDPLFPNVRGGGRLSSDGVAYLLAKHVSVARRTCPSLNRKRISPHVLRHTTAMNLLHAGVDRAIIALWLGHESVQTTQVYIEADLALKERMLNKLRPPRVRAGRYKPDDQVLAFLNGL